MLISDLKDKVIAIWGMGREGNALLEYFSKHNIGKEIRTFVDDTEVNLQGVEIVVKSPGVSAYKPEIIQAKNNGIRFTSASDLFLNEIRTNKPKCKVIGISGSKGKSTSVSALYHIMQKAGCKVGLGGNIGRPIIELLDGDYDYIIGEFSSYQATDLSVSPHIVMFTNLFYVHTDWHNHSHEQYCKDKLHLVANQQKGDIYFANVKNSQLSEYSDSYPQYRKWYNQEYGYFAKGRELFYKNKKVFSINDLKLSGDHNIDNLAGVFSILEYLNFDIDKAVEALKEFEPLEHRLQNFAVKNNIKFINDSISTAPEAAIGAMKSFDENIAIISGGQYLEQDYTQYAEFVENNSKIKFVGAMYQSGPALAKEIKNKVTRNDCKLIENDDLTEVVKEAYLLLKTKGQGGCVLFSPTAPSFGFYKNFMERGQHFMDVVKKMLEQDI